MPPLHPKLPSIGLRLPELTAGAAPASPGGETDSAGAKPEAAETESSLADESAPEPSARPQRPALRFPRGAPRPFLHMPTISVPSWSAIETSARELLAGPAEAARPRMQNPRELSDSIAMGKAIWRELVIGFAAQLGELSLGFTQLAALYALADSGTMTMADMADTLGRSPSATSRLVESLVRRQLVERRQDSEDRRQRTVSLTARGKAVMGRVDRARAEAFLSIVRPLPTSERAVVAMGVAALAANAISGRGHLIKMRRPRKLP
jgi:DNA-binding MarR family transcriptional regulator